MPAEREKLVLFGAGNIGRSFIGQLFAAAGHEVVFVDIDPTLVDELNRHRGYRIFVKRGGSPDRQIPVSGVRAVLGTDTRAVEAEIIDASLIATAVGQAAISHVLPVIAAGISARFAAGKSGIDIIIAENVRNASEWYRCEIFAAINAPESPESTIGLVETSIGKMVPIMTRHDREADPLQVFAEEYNTLIVDAKGFKNGIPDVPGLKAVENIRAYVDRKLFVHNLGHAAIAYLGFAAHPEYRYVHEQIADQTIAAAVRKAMLESASALNREYPADLALADLQAHVDDLLSRFDNPALKDTVHRVGRDLPRKLGREDRLVGAMLLAANHHLPFGAIADAASAAFSFAARDEEGALYPADRKFLDEAARNGAGWALTEICGLAPSAGGADETVHAALEERLSAP